jgi:outer membrane protein assembly factor BamB
MPNSEPQPAKGAPSNRTTVVAVVVLGLVGFGTLCFILNRSRQPVRGLEEHRPGMDRPAGMVAGTEQSPIERGRLITGNGTPGKFTGQWPWFRGPQLTMIDGGPPPLAREWGEKGPPLLWGVDMGEGCAGAAIHGGRVFVIDYDQKEQGDALRCLSLADGQEIWRYFYPIKIKRNHGMSRTIPAVTDKYVVSIGPKCQVICVEAATGKFVWGMDLVKSHGTVVPEWYAGQCPIIEGDNVILAPSGEHLLMAVELATGKVVWQTPNPRDWKMTHTSLTPMVFNGRRQYIYAASDGVAGVSAEDGKLLWDSDIWKVQIAACASPVVVGADRIFFSGGYNAGSMLARLKEQDGKVVLEELWRLKAKDFGSTQQTPILYQDHLYGVRPDGQFTCLDLAGKIRWTSTAAEKFGLGPYLLAHGLLYILGDEGRMVLAEANPTAYRPVARATVVGHDAWGPMALADGRLVCRDLTRMVCLDVSGGK